MDIGSDSGIPDADDMLRHLPNSGGYTLIHCAGHVHRPVESPDEVERFFSINSTGTQRVVALAKRIGVRRILYISSIAFYDWANLQNAVPLSESARTSAMTAYARSKLEGERWVLESRLDSRVVRLATVFGTGDRANFSKLALALKRRRFILPGTGCAAKSVISVDKAAEWISRYAFMENPPSRLINLGFAKLVTLREIVEAFHDECGFPLPPSGPIWLLKSLASLGSVLAVIRTGFPFTRPNLAKLMQSTAVDCTQAAEIFPEILDCNFRQSLRDASEYYKRLSA
jgi:UDP-glucose 4-epimerase